MSFDTPLNKGNLLHAKYLTHIYGVIEEENNSKMKSFLQVM